MNDLKKKLYNLCTQYIQKSISASEQAIESARSASNDDTKSSAGDKYETGRAMMQQETDRNMTQLNEANKLRVALEKINPDIPHDTAEPGSVVLTSNGNFYIAISAGKFIIDNDAYFVVSPASPIGLKLKGKKTGEGFELNGKNYQIVSIF